MFTVGSLFSGIGGLELGLERTGGFKTIWHSEIDPYASAVLRKHWPGIPNLWDIRRVDWGTIERPDLICGGFPCQDVSSAGKKRGIKESTRSGLWFEFAKAIRVLRPRFVLIENVSDLLKRGGEIVLANIASFGYDAEWLVIRASDVGALHTRKRVFFFAHSDGIGRDSGKYPWKTDEVLQNGKRHLEDAKANRDGQSANPSNRFETFAWVDGIAGVRDLLEKDLPKPLLCGNLHGVSNRVDRVKCLGNAVVPQVAQVIGEAILESEKNE